MATTQTRVYELDKKNFQRGLKYAKQFGGKYDPETKTWIITTTEGTVADNSLRAPRAYGLIPVAAPEPVYPDNIDDPRYWQDRADER